MRGTDSSRNWFHVASPEKNFDKENLAIYEKVKSARIEPLMDGAAVKSGAFSEL